MGCSSCRDAKTLLLSDKQPRMHFSDPGIQEAATAFRTAYAIAKERLAFRKMTPLMKLQELKETGEGNVHRSDHACAEIVDHVANEMKKKVVSNIKEKNYRISLTTDESTVFGLASYSSDATYLGRQ